MEATEFLINFSVNYPAIANFIKLLAFIAGMATVGTGVWIVLRIELFGTMQPGQYTWGTLIIMFLLGGCMLSFGWTMNLVANTVFDYGGYVLQAYQGTEEWRVREGMTSRRAMQEFVIATCKICGMIFGFWGLLSAALATRPNSENTYWAGLIRAIVGAGLFNPIKFLDMFGGWGSRYLQPDV